MNRLSLKPYQALDPPRSAAEIDEDLAFFAGATARIDNTPDDWRALWDRLQASSDLRGASDEQWTRFNRYAKIAFVNAV